MKKYRISNSFYIINILMLVVSAAAVFFSFYYMINTILKAAFTIAFLMITYGLIGLPFSYSTITNEQLIQRTIGRNRTILLNEVEYIIEQPNSNLAKVAVGVFGGSKRISITSWTNEYKKLIKIIIDKCRYNPGIKIDSKVLKIIEGM